MDVLGLKATITLDTKDYENALDGASKKTNSFGSKLKNGLAKAAKAGAVAIGAASTAIGTLAKAAIDGYANYEQLVGGVETLFGTGGKSLEEYAASTGKSVIEVAGKYSQLELAQTRVLNNAANAFRDAGMSQNEYMETVTSFSASLIQSLGGDTVRAADLAQVAIVDMADNANKMGKFSIVCPC